MRPMKSALLLSAILASALASGACGGKSTGANEPTAEPTPLAAGAWEGMNDRARASFMKKTVLPTMTAKFKAFDAERFGDVGCKTCHGPGADEGKFDMPSGALPELDFANPDPDDARINDFMVHEVKPTMAHLLGLSEYSPENPTGFGCLECHTMAKGE